MWLANGIAKGISHNHLLVNCLIIKPVAKLAYTKHVKNRLKKTGTEGSKHLSGNKYLVYY